MINQIAQGLTYFLAMLFCLTFHESAHAFAAHLRGDDTAKREGRLSLNPAAHADLVGTIILPLAGFLMGMPIIGWAKPVPLNVRNLKRPSSDAVIVALAGPFSNLVFGFLCVVMLFAYQRYGFAILPPDSFFYPLIKLLGAMAFVNGALAFFNLIPLPPLDGAALLKAILPTDIYESYEAVAAPYGFIVLFMLAFSGGLAWIGSLTRAWVGLCEIVVQHLFGS